MFIINESLKTLSYSDFTDNFETQTSGHFVKNRTEIAEEALETSIDHRKREKVAKAVKEGCQTG